MNIFSALLAVALLAYTVSATPCTDICNRKCDLQKQTCDFSKIFGDLCTTVNSVCTQACNAACGCADSCAAQCGGEYATCKGDGSGILNMYHCGIGLSVCSSSCHIRCKFNLFASFVDSLGGGDGDSGSIGSGDGDSGSIGGGDGDSGSIGGGDGDSSL